MKKCLLCDRNEADKTGSHIVPHFLAKRIDNEPGTRGRDKELGFVIDISSTRMYFGRGISPETLEEVYGEVDQQLIEQNKIDGVVDYILCTNCEKRLAAIESKYAPTIQQQSPADEVYESLHEPGIGFLFWASVIFRLAIMEDSNFRMKNAEKKKLARVLDRYLRLDVKDIKMNTADTDLTDIGYKIVRSSQFSDSYPTFQYSSPFYGRPYVAMIDEYIIFFYFRKSYLKGLADNFFGSYNFQKASPFLTPFDNEKIYGISHSDYEQIVSNMVHFFAEKKLKHLMRNLDGIHRRLFPRHGKAMELPLKLEILRNITESKAKLGKRNVENDISIIEDTVAQYYKIRK